jgi:hypothetical protein
MTKLNGTKSEEAFPRIVRKLIKQYSHILLNMRAKNGRRVLSPERKPDVDKTSPDSNITDLGAH